MFASRNFLMVLVLVLVAALAVIGYSLYQEKKQPDGVEISVGRNGLSIKEK
jgi:predicted negative regulator of RcsB-dependent stress response